MASCFSFWGQWHRLLLWQQLVFNSHVGIFGSKHKLSAWVGCNVLVDTRNAWQSYLGIPLLRFIFGFMIPANELVLYKKPLTFFFGRKHIGPIIAEALVGLLFLFSEERMQDPYEIVGTKALTKDEKQSPRDFLRGPWQIIKICPLNLWDGSFLLIVVGNRTIGSIVRKRSLTSGGNIFYSTCHGDSR